MTPDASAAPSGGVGPFRWFGLAGVLGAAWAIAMGLGYAATPTFTTAALPTIVGVTVAVAAFLWMGYIAPANE